MYMLINYVISDGLSSCSCVIRSDAQIIWQIGVLVETADPLEKQTNSNAQISI
jgi:hypothetical protein